MRYFILAISDSDVNFATHCSRIIEAATIEYSINFMCSFTAFSVGMAILTNMFHWLRLFLLRNNVFVKVTSVSVS